MINDEQILSAIGSTEETTFSEFCQALGEDCPDSKNGWAFLFSQLKKLETQGYIKIFRTGSTTDGFILTEQGANLVRDRLDAKRGLLR